MIAMEPISLEALNQIFFAARTHHGWVDRPVTDQELRRTAVYELRIESWSGKENWQEHADQSADWPPLDERWEA